MDTGTALNGSDRRAASIRGRVIRIPALILAGMILAKTVNEVSFWVADRAFPLVADLDPDGVFLHITIHHLVQLAITLVVMALAIRAVPGQSWTRFGFTWKGARQSLPWVAGFAMIWLLIQAGVGYLLVSQGTSADPGYPLTARNVAGRLGFQLFLSGTGEEPLYRGLIMTAMLVAWSGLFGSRRALGWAAAIGATLVFMFDHINVSLSPFAVTHVDLLQQATLLVFGLFYALLFLRSGSLVGPIVAHGVLNVIITVVGYWLFLSVA